MENTRRPLPVDPSTVESVDDGYTRERDERTTENDRGFLDCFTKRTSKHQAGKENYKAK